MHSRLTSGAAGHYRIMAAPAPQPQHSDEEEAFIAGDDGAALDGEVLDDLVGEGACGSGCCWDPCCCAPSLYVHATAGMDGDDDDSDEEQAGAAPSTSGPAEHDMHDDDSWHCFEGHTGEGLAPCFHCRTGSGGTYTEVKQRHARCIGLMSDPAPLPTHPSPHPAADAVLAVAWSSAPGGVVATGGVDDRAFLWRVRGQHLTLLMML